MDRASKIVLLVWACAALTCHTLLGRTWPGMPATAATIFVIVAAVVAYERRFVAVVLALTYVVPAVVRLVFGTWDPQYYPLWTAALLGAMMPSAVRSGWHLPPLWRAPLIAATLSVAIATSITALRELDFNPALLGPTPHAVLSGLPVFFAAWAVHVGLTLVLGVLWFDWLLGTRDLDMTTWVLVPLGISLVALAAASSYQLFGDITFLNETVYAAIGRASGTVYDANVAGVLTAMGLGGALVAVARAHGWRLAVSIASVGVLWVAVWASGSRTAFAAAAIVTTSGVVGIVRSLDAAAARRVWLIAASVVVVLVVLAGSGLRAVGPVGRVWATLPSLSWTSIGAFGAEMWNRNGYGVASTELVRRFPVSGIGVGSFHAFGPQLAHLALPPDNAQNWYRHQVVELGLLGSAGWLIFAGLFGWSVIRPPCVLPASAWCVRGVLLAFGAISFLGVPTQEVPAAVTFWTAAAWYALLCGATPGPSALGLRTWALITAAVLLFGASTVRAATTTLRVPARARAIGWPYSYGFYGPESDLEGGEHRWAERRAAALVDAPARYVSLAVRVNHADIGSRPVHAKVWIEGRLVLETRLTSGAPARVTVPVPVGLKQVLIDTWVDHVLHPRDFGVADDRELGLLVGWRFSAEPPEQ